MNSPIDCHEETDSLIKRIDPNNFSLDRDCHEIISQNELPYQDKSVYFNSSKKDFFSVKYNIVNTWEGIIEEISDSIIYTRMFDYETETEDTGEFHRDNFPSVFEDKTLRVGRLFYLYIGYTESPYRSQTAIIKLRPLPNLDLTTDDYNIVLDRVNKNKALLKQRNEQTICR